MKTLQLKLKTLLLLILVSFIFTSCGNDKKGEKDLKNQMDQLEDGDSFAGSSKRDDICQLLTEADVRSVFDLSDTIKIKQKKTRGTLCTYNWDDPESRYLSYTLSLNFAAGGNRNKSQIDQAWESQNKGVYKKHKPQKVSGVGDRASWSDLGGGQLRVATDGHIFYMTFFVFPKNKNPMNTQEMIDKASTLSERVIEKM